MRSWGLSSALKQNIDHDLFFFWWNWDLNFLLTKQALYYLRHTSSPFFSGYFGDGILQTICPGWPQTVIFSISTSQVAKITGLSHWHPVGRDFLETLFLFAFTTWDSLGSSFSFLISHFQFFP
jgi:hypothetical protein